MKKLLITLLLLFTVVAGSQTVNYTESSENISNPERGLYKYFMGKSMNFIPLNQPELTNLKTNQKITLVWRGYLLDKFKTIPISQSFLNSIQSDFNTLRASGMKCILRFSYTEDGGSDTSKSMMLGHMDQLELLCQQNQDVISSMEAGFIGDYGEWYSSNNFGTSNLTMQNYLDRLAVADKIMKLTPQRVVAFRTPTIMFHLYGNNPVSLSTAFNESFNSRMGYHNDCYLRSDMGNFVNESQEYSYLTLQTKFTIAGGETCGLENPFTLCPNAIENMELFHFNYLNSGYHPDNINYWTSNGCYPEIVNRLGYRFVFNNSTVLSSTLSLSLTNKGFGNLFNQRKAYLIYRNTITGEEYSREINTDPRLWQSGNNVILNIPFDTTLPNGSYNLLINLPDYQMPLNPAYSIRVANNNTWEASTGFNKLNQIVTISNLNVHAFVKDDTILINLSDYKLTLYDITGGEVSKSADMSGLASGIYIVKINSDGRNYTRKIIKK